MIAKIKAMILDDGDAAATEQVDDVEAAAVALLVEAAVIDGDFDAAERRTIAALPEERFGFDADAASELIAAGERAVESASQLYAFTRVIKDSFDADQRVRMIEMLWEIAYADGALHDFEASLVRRVAGLIHVPDRLSGAARKRVLARLGLDRPGA
jgi:uncharacterized tellurite resistance protein B-like protein